MKSCLTLALLLFALTTAANAQSSQNRVMCQMMSETINKTALEARAAANLLDDQQDWSALAQTFFGAERTSLEVTASKHATALKAMRAYAAALEEAAYLLRLCAARSF